MYKNTLKVIAIVLVLTFAGQPVGHAASKSKIEAWYKKIYRQMVAANNNEALYALTAYDVEVKRAIGRVLDGKTKCDSRSKALYKSKAFDSYSSEVDQVINGFYLGYCNAK